MFGGVEVEVAELSSAVDSGVEAGAVVVADVDEGLAGGPGFGGFVEWSVLLVGFEGGWVEVDVVGVAAAGHGDVEGVGAHGGCGEGVGFVDGGALGCVDGGGVGDVEVSVGDVAGGDRGGVAVAGGDVESAEGVGAEDGVAVAVADVVVGSAGEVDVCGRCVGP